MGYPTPHHAREWFSAAALMVCHDYQLQSLYRSQADVKKILMESKEIDLHARLASFFGASVSISAQGSSKLDVDVRSPRLDAEIKFLIDHRNGFEGVKKDWDWLLKDSQHQVLRQKAWVVFLPCKDYYTFPDCQNINRPTGKNLSWETVAPFLAFAEPFMPPNGTKQKLRWRTTVAPRSVIWMPGGKKVRVDCIGTHTDCLWAMVYTRITPDDYKSLVSFTDFQIADETMTTVTRTVT